MGINKPKKRTLRGFKKQSEELKKNMRGSAKVVDGLRSASRWGKALSKVLEEIFDGEEE